MVPIDTDHFSPTNPSCWFGFNVYEQKPSLNVTRSMGVSPFSDTFFASLPHFSV